MQDHGRYRLQSEKDDEVQKQPTDGSLRTATKRCRSFSHISILFFIFSLSSLKVKFQSDVEVIHGVIHIDQAEN